MKCDKCRKEITGAAIVVDYGFYHPTCTSMRPRKGKIADVMKGNMSRPLSYNTVGV
jgi:hypothetical protein